MLRNPDNQPRQFALDVETAFELPSGTSRRYACTSPWSEAAGQPAWIAIAGEPRRLKLAPFEVLVLDAAPLPM